MLTVISDTHLGAIRSSGTTPATQWALRQHLLKSFESLLPDSGDLLINGDLLDTANIPVSDVLMTYEIISDWLNARSNATLYVSGGNHDFPKTSTAMSSFQFLGKLLSRGFPDRYVHIESPTMTPYGYVIPHCINQDLFDAALAAIPECDVVYLHCNVDSPFAAHSDQSLNITLEQIAAVPAKHIICAHEHHKRKVGKVLLPGNQFASSVADFLSNQDKFMAVIEVGVPRLVKTADRATQYTELNWRNLEETEHLFIRVTGSVEQTESHEVVNALAAFRRRSKALVITNAVQVLSAEGLSENFEATLEAAKGFDVIKCLLETLDDEEKVVVEGLL